MSQGPRRNSSGRGHEPPSGSERPSGSDEGRLLDSQDLFGDMVDAPPDEKGTQSAPKRDTPIRIQVSEPAIGSADERSEGEEPQLAADVSRLLDNVFGPSDEKPETDEPSQGFDEDAGVELRPIHDGTEPPPQASAKQAPALFEELADLFGPGKKGSDDSAAEKKASRKGSMRFKAKPPGRTGADIDLAALAEQALETSERKPTPIVNRNLPSAGDKFGPYSLLERVAVGGMAEVFRAKRSGVEGFEKVVAVKRILAHLLDNQEFVDMFINEAKMVAGLTHPNIVQIFDLGKIEGAYFIAMEYVHGRDLRTILKRGREQSLRMPLDLAISVIGRVCAGLDYAHRKRDDEGHAMEIVHRDVSPQNILISFEGDVKLADFGIAKAATKAQSAEAGSLRGKLLYMSPEQAWGRPIDRRSDVFSLGVVFYEMITDQKPFVASSETSALESVRLCRIASPTTVNPRIPDRIERVVMKALDRDPENRYQDAGEMARDLDRVLQGRQVPAATELARYLELLFDERERGLPQRKPAEEVPVDDVPARLEVDMEGAAPVRKSSPKSSTEPSVEDLMKRLRVK